MAVTQSPPSHDDSLDALASTAATQPRKRGLSAEAAWGSLFALFGLVIGIGQMADNSLLTHLATGRWIVDNVAIPRQDLYTFTSAGEPWVVQSWLASLIYGLIDATVGEFGLRLFFGASCAGLGALTWRLSRPAGTLLPRIALSLPALAIGAVMWSQRPLLFGLLGIAVVLLLVEQSDRDLRWLVPLMWVWVNTHGSYPLAIVLLITLGVGAMLDGQRPERIWSAVKWCLIGTLVGGFANPYGPKMLTFPIELLGKVDALRHINEWKSPSFDQLYARMFLALAMVAVLAAVRGGKLRTALPVVVFLAAALMGVRNLSIAAMVFVAMAAPSLSGIGSIAVGGRSRLTRMMTIAAAAGGVVVVLVASTTPNIDTGRFPVDAVDYLEDNGVAFSDTRVFHSDRTGNYVGFRDGAGAGVFIDDRFELHATTLVQDYLTVVGGNGAWAETLDRYAIDVVLFGNGGPLSQLIAADDAWRIVYDDADETGDVAVGNFVACRTRAAVCDQLSG